MEVVLMRLFECLSNSQIIQQPWSHVDPQLHPHDGHGVRNPGVLRRERGGATESAVSVSVSGCRYEIIVPINLSSDYFKQHYLVLIPKDL